MRTRGPDGEPVKTLTYQGIEIAIDRPIGTTIEITLPDGTKKTRVYTEDYGFFPGVPGGDGGSLDVYVGADRDAQTAFVVAQVRADSGAFDELKVLVGYTFGWAARDAYLRHAAPEMLGGMGELSVASIREQLDAQRGQSAPARIVVGSVLEGSMPDVAPPAPASEDEQPPAWPLIPPKGGIAFLDHKPPSARQAPRAVSSTMKNHEHTRFNALARALAVLTLSSGGLDGNDRTALESVAADAGAPRRRGPQEGHDALHLRTVDVRAVRKEVREVDYVASTETIDSYGEVLRQNWIFDRFNKNPVILWAHNNDWAVPTLPVGRSVRHVVENKQLLITPKFSVVNPFAIIVFDMIVEGTLCAGSVGFRPHKVSRETINGAERTVCDQNELYEFSICPMGANPDALVIESEERMAKMLDELSRKAVHSIPQARSGGPLTNQNPAPAGKRNTMKIKTLTKEQHQDLARRGVVTHECEGCKDVLVLEAPEVVTLAQEHKELSAKATAAEHRAVAAEQAKAEAETRAKSAEDRAAAAESAKATLVQERDAATKRADDEKKKADEAVSAKAALELGPLTGLDAWQLSPAQAQRLAQRAATDPAGYAADVADVREKGVKAGALKADALPRAQETQTPDQRPPTQQLNAAAADGEDPDLMAAIKERSQQLAATRASNIVVNALTSGS